MKMFFGKYKGSDIKDIPTDYLEYIASESSGFVFENIMDELMDRCPTCNYDELLKGK